MFGWLKRKLETRQAAALAERQLAAIAGVSDFLTPITYRETESLLPAAVACIDFISHSVASLPIRICRKDGTRKEIVTEGLIYDLLKDPHPHYSGPTELMLLAMRDLLATGNSVIAIDEIDGRMTLTHIPWVYVTSPYREYNAGYRVTWPGGESKDLPASDVIHARIGCEDGGFIGKSPLGRNASTVALSKLIEQATAGLWANGCYSSFALKTTKLLTSEQRGDLRKSLKDQVAGINKGSPLFLDADFTIQPLTVNSKDLQQLETRQFNGIVNVCMVYKVSPVLIGDLRFGTYSNYQQARIGWFSDGISIYQKLFSELFTKKLLENYPDQKIELDNSHILQDRDAKVKEVTELVKAGVIDAEEAKKELGYG